MVEPDSLGWIQVLRQRLAKNRRKIGPAAVQEHTMTLQFRIAL